jgi:hypothetical protein
MANLHDETPGPVLSKLPNELLNNIFELLPNHDIKSLRLTCRHLGSHAPLRLDRLFISANPLNISVFLAVANHDSFRNQVREIIWDDATFMSFPDDDRDSEFGYSSDENEIFYNMDYETKGDISSWFVQKCKEEIFNAESRLVEKGNDNEQQRQLDNLMPLREALSYYTHLVQQQDNVIKSGADEQAFRYAL